LVKIENKAKYLRFCIVIQKIIKNPSELVRPQDEQGNKQVHQGKEVVLMCLLLLKDN